MHTEIHTQTHTLRWKGCYLLAALLHHEEQVGAVGHGEGEAVLERVGAVVVVADAVLVDVVHGEAAGLPVVLPVAGALDGAVPGRLHHGEDDGLRLAGTIQGLLQCVIRQKTEGIIQGYGPLQKHFYVYYCFY